MHHIFKKYHSELTHYYSEVPQFHIENILAYYSPCKSYPKTHLSKTKRDRPYILSRNTKMILKTTHNDIYSLTVLQPHIHEILQQKVILCFLKVSCEATARTIPSHPLNRSFRLPMIESLSPYTITYI